MKKRVSWKRKEAEEIVEGGSGVDVRGGRGELEQPLEWGETFTWAVTNFPCALDMSLQLLAHAA